MPKSGLRKTVIIARCKENYLRQMSVPKLEVVVRFRDFDFGTALESEFTAFGLVVQSSPRNGRFWDTWGIV